MRKIDVGTNRPRPASLREQAEAHIFARAARAGKLRTDDDEPLGATSWNNEEFEDWVCRALIASHERRLIKIKQDRAVVIKKPCLKSIRQHGIFIPAGDRLINSTIDGQGRFSFDTHNDPLPKRGIFARSCSLGHAADWIENIYMLVVFVERTTRMPKGWSTEEPGKIYSVKEIAFGDRGYAGKEHYVTVSADGAITACRLFRERMACDTRGGFRILGVGTNETSKSDMSLSASAALQFQADRRFTWSIDAYDGGARVNLGCTKEEVKSLLYARTAPVTPSGRKRPIMHLVQSHRRRMASGIDVDVTSFLRGTQEIEIDGTLFRVRAPVVHIPALSDRSVSHYYSTNEVKGELS